MSDDIRAQLPISVDFDDLVVDVDSAVSLSGPTRCDGLDEDPQLLKSCVGSNTHPNNWQTQTESLQSQWNCYDGRLKMPKKCIDD